MTFYAWQITGSGRTLFDSNPTELALTISVAMTVAQVGLVGGRSAAGVIAVCDHCQFDVGSSCLVLPLCQW